jgi:hypothetical protein
VEYVVQRLGFVPDKVGHGVRTGPLREALKLYALLPWVELRSFDRRSTVPTPEPLEHDARLLDVSSFFSKGAQMPSIAEDVATDRSTLRARTTGSRR